MTSNKKRSLQITIFGTVWIAVWRCWGTKVMTLTQSTSRKKTSIRKTLVREINTAVQRKMCSTVKKNIYFPTKLSEDGRKINHSKFRTIYIKIANCMMHFIRISMLWERRLIRSKSRVCSCWGRNVSCSIQERSLKLSNFSWPNSSLIHKNFYLATNVWFFEFFTRNGYMNDYVNFSTKWKNVRKNFTDAW